MKRRTVAWLALLAALGGFAGYSVWRAQQAIGTSRTEHRRSNEIPYAMRALDGNSAAGLDLLTSRLPLMDAAALDGKWYVLTSQRLIEVDSDGRETAAYRCGIELPAAPLESMTTGVAGGAQRRELYIATSGAGVLLFDGKAFRQLLPEAVAARRITALLPLESGQLLIGTDKAGLLVWDGSRLTWFHESLKNVPVTALAGRLDSLWIGTMDRGAVHMRAGQVDSFKDLPDPHVLSLAVKEDRAFAGTSAGVSELGGEAVSRVVAEGVFAKALLAGDDTLWIGTMEDGLLEMPLRARQPRPRSAATVEGTGEVRRLKAADGAILAVLAEKVMVRESGKWRRVPLDLHTGPGFSDANVSSIAIEDTGRVWVGYFDRGLDIWDPSTGRVAHLEDEYLFCVNRIALRRDGAVIATANGLVLTDRAGKTRQVITRTQGLIATHATDVLLEDNGMVVAT
ncbi:MAG: hypothetical protein JNL98_18395, partial [Bryobacterales bacterium]|nr:hypothetical protein [Bryobacterales bacterium]